MTAPTSHLGVSPTTAADAILAALAPFSATAGGCLKTLKRFQADRYDIEAIDLQLAGGAPAILVAYLGGPWECDATHRMRFKQRMRFSLICAAGRYDTIGRRLAGGASVETAPGLEDLLDWATYFGVRALATTAGLSGVTALEHKMLRVEPEKYLGACELEATRRIDTEDDTGTLEALVSIGIVHSPLGPDDTPAVPGALFEVDNETPKQTPPEVGGGVTEL